MTIHKNITPFNRWIGRDGYDVEWITIHYTANTYQPDLAKNEAAAFANRYVGASAHFFVDEKEVWQSVALDDTAWHCGDAPSRNGCHNRNSIGIEMCVKYENGVYSIPEKTAARTAELVLYLLEFFPKAKLCRHYDITGKICPAPWVTDPSLWEAFLMRVEENRPMTQAERKEFDALKARVASLSAKVSAGEEFDRIIRRDVAKLGERSAVKWNKADGMPDWLAPTVAKLISMGCLKGDKKGDLALTTDLARALVVVDRAGGFDR
ncbi:MAG: N-acetylmuramoyl-L-alanine amidase [Clostridia bacterium]|nr:N-acetylmuramoyl-L-alanine amidase [Clostridia bacterium]